MLVYQPLVYHTKTITESNHCYYAISSGTTFYTDGTYYYNAGSTTSNGRHSYSDRLASCSSGGYCCCQPTAG